MDRPKAPPFDYFEMREVGYCRCSSWHMECTFVKPKKPKISCTSISLILRVVSAVIKRLKLVNIYIFSKFLIRWVPVEACIIVKM